MGKAETYDDLIFKLGDLARERLANRANSPRAMARVFRAEDLLVARREELEALEHQMNEEDANYRDFLAQQEADRAEQTEIVRKWKKAVDAIEGRTKDLRKQLSSRRAAIRYDKASIERAEQRHKDLEFAEGPASSKLAQSRENLKKLRIALMRKQREVEELEAQFAQVLTPQPGQPGAQGILAHKRLLEMEDEAETRKADFDQLMQELDEDLGAKEEELKAAEEYLDQALYLLGEECYASRLADPALAAFYPKLDKAK